MIAAIWLAVPILAEYGYTAFAGVVEDMKRPSLHGPAWEAPTWDAAGGCNMYRVQVRNVGDAPANNNSMFGGYDAGGERYWSAQTRSYPSILPGATATLEMCLKSPPENICTRTHFTIQADRARRVSADGSEFCT